MGVDVGNRVFVIADTHFGHVNVIEFEKEHRPFASIEEHDEELVRRWNDTVRKDDTVWHLGDAVFGRHNLPILGRLNGRKNLVMGNHDHYPSEEYLRYFCKVQGVVKMRDYIFTHVPVHPFNMGRFKGNIHGHMHSRAIPDPRYFCASVEIIGLAPVLLDTVIHMVENANVNGN
jgi:calcineurin-like phosphoesterase family protein